MSMIKEKLENLVNDITTLEVATLKTELTSDNNRKLFAYSLVQTEGDQINIIDPQISSTDSELITLHKQILINSQKGRLAFASFAVNTLKSIL